MGQTVTSYLCIVVIPLGLYCLLHVSRALRSDTVKTRVGNRRRERAPGTFWMTIFFESLVGGVLLLVGVWCLLKAIGRG